MAMKVPYVILDSPVVLGTAAACIVVYGLSLLHPGILAYFAWPSWHFSSLSFKVVTCCDFVLKDLWFFKVQRAPLGPKV